MRPWILRVCALALTLAIGVVLGAGPLQRSAAQRDRDLADQRTALASARGRIADLTAGAAFADRFALATSGPLLHGALTGRTIALIVLPGADPALVTALQQLIVVAGGVVTGQVSLAPVMAQASSRQLVEALTSQMIAQNPQVAAAPSSGGYQLFGDLLARALTVTGTKAAQAPYDATAVAIISGFETANLLTAAKVTARAGVALVISGASIAGAANDVPATVLGALGTRIPTVVAGPSAAADADGLLVKLRAVVGTPVLSTVDTLETAMGRIATVLALSARLKGTVGNYGAIGSTNGPFPAR